MRDAKSELTLVNNTGSEFEEAHAVVSSANNIDFVFVMACGKSFVYIINNKGQRTEPCGTPQVIILV